jgi:hypothetical protein
MTTDAITQSYITLKLVTHDSYSSRLGVDTLTVTLATGALVTFIRNQYKLADDFVRFNEHLCNASQLSMIVTGEF